MTNLSAYIPQDRRVALARGVDLPDRCVGAALFADISGFTPLARVFAAEMGAQRGAEALLGAATRPARRAGGCPSATTAAPCCAITTRSVTRRGAGATTSVPPTSRSSAIARRVCAS